MKIVFCGKWGRDIRTVTTLLSRAVIEKLKAKKLVQVVRKVIGDTQTYFDFPDAHWRRIRTNNPLERILREVRRRTRVGPVLFS